MIPISPERYAEMRERIDQNTKIQANTDCCRECPGCHAPMILVALSNSRGGEREEKARGHANLCMACGQFWAHMVVDSLPLPPMTEEQRVWMNEHGVKGYV